MESRDWSSDVCSSDLFPSHDTSTNHIQQTKPHNLPTPNKKPNSPNHPNPNRTNYRTLKPQQQLLPTDQLPNIQPQHQHQYHQHHPQQTKNNIQLPLLHQIHHQKPTTTHHHHPQQTQPKLPPRMNFQISNLNTNTNTTYRDWETDRKSTRLNSSHEIPSRMPSSA